MCAVINQLHVLRPTMMSSAIEINSNPLSVTGLEIPLSFNILGPLELI